MKWPSSDAIVIAVISALLGGVSSLAVARLMFNEQIKDTARNNIEIQTKAERAAAEARRQSEQQAIESRFQRIEGDVKRAHERLDQSKLAYGEIREGTSFGCGGSDKATTADQFMVGEKDGTSCGVPNINYYRSIALQVPAR